MVGNGGKNILIDTLALTYDKDSKYLYYLELLIEVDGVGNLHPYITSPLSEVNYKKMQRHLAIRYLIYNPKNN